jgi:hypothetical protein
MDNQEIEDAVSNSLTQIQDENGKKIQVINKRVNFEKKTLKKIEIMMPVYSSDISSDVSNNVTMSYIIQKAIDKLFESDFKARLEEM